MLKHFTLTWLELTQVWSIWYRWYNKPFVYIQSTIWRIDLLICHICGLDIHPTLHPQHQEHPSSKDYKGFCNTVTKTKIQYTNTNIILLILIVCQVTINIILYVSGFGSKCKMFYKIYPLKKWTILKIHKQQNMPCQELRQSGIDTYLLLALLRYQTCWTCGHLKEFTSRRQCFSTKQLLGPEYFV